MLIQPLDHKIKQCMFYTVDSEGNLVQVLDVSQTLELCLEQIVELTNRINLLESKQNATIKIKQPRILQKKY